MYSDDGPLTPTAGSKRKGRVENLNRFVSFRGELGRGDLRLPVRFRVRFGADGELRFQVSDIPHDAAAGELRALWDKSSRSLPFFQLRGRSRAGTVFASDHVVIPRIGHNFTPDTAHLTLSLRCSKGAFRIEPPAAQTRPYIRFALRGFEAHPAVRATCELGVVTMAGRYPRLGYDRVSGYLLIVAPDGLSDVEAWRSRAEALCGHLRSLMSFALSFPIKAPVRQVWDGATLELVALSQTPARHGGQHVLHPMRLQPFLEAAVAAFFKPAVKAENLAHVLEWCAMEATYTESRLMNAMTALETLADSNLEDADKFMLQRRKDFDKIAKAMRKAAAATLGEVEKATPEAEFFVSLSSKMADLNRRPLKMKLLCLARKLDVPLQGISDEHLSAAIKARNTIVHRGWYYEPAPGTAEQQNLWDHVLLARELVTRFVFTAIGYQGPYLSFRGGQHDLTFPPEP